MSTDTPAPTESVAQRYVAVQRSDDFVRAAPYPAPASSSR